MRNAGEGVPGGSSGRRQRAAEPPAAARTAGNGGASLFTPAYRVRHPATVPGAGGQPTTQRDGGYGYDASPYQGADYSAGGEGYGTDLPSGGYSWMTDDSDGSGWPVAGLPGYGSAGRGVSNAIRGFAPVPDEPLPSYPPGPFAAWNRGASGSDGGSASGGSGGTERDFGDSREGSSRSLASATITPDEFDTDYSLPAIKDPSRPSSSSSSSSAGRAAAVAAGRGPVTDDKGGRSAGGRGRRAAAAPARSGRAKPKPTSKPKPKARARAKHQILAIGTAVVVVAAVAAVLVITSLGKPNSPTKPRAANTPSPKAAPTPTAPAGKWGFIGTRKTDTIPLTLHELFPSSFITGGVYFHVAKLQPGHDCHTGLIGGALQAAVRKANCIQDMRASYVARLDNAMATIGVFNLRSAAAASKAALKTGPSEFVAQLSSKNGVTSKIGQGTGLEEAIVKGHYLVLVWAEKIDLTAPKTAWQRGRLTRFMNTLLQDTVISPLSFRQVEGKPQKPTHTLPSSPAA